MTIKNFLPVSILAVGLLAGVLSAQTQTPLQQPLADFDKLVSHLKVGAVIGEPITVGDTIIVPFAKVHFGLGGGGAMMAFGGGMGGKTVPLGVLIIEGDKVRAELFPEEEKQPSFLQQMLPVLLKMLPEMMGGKFPPVVAGKTQAPAAGSKTEAKPSPPPENASLDNAKKLFEEKKFEDALAMLDALLAKEPDNADLHAWKGHVMGNMAQGNPANMMKYGMGAMQEYETALSLDPQNADAHFGRGVTRMVAPPGFGGDIDGAIADFEASLAKKPSPEAYYYLGQAYQKKGLADAAKEAYKRALKLKPDYAEASAALKGMQ